MGLFDELAHALANAETFTDAEEHLEAEEATARAEELLGSVLRRHSQNWQHLAKCC